MSPSPRPTARHARTGHQARQARHARLFELIRQENLARRCGRHHPPAAPDATEARQWLSRAAQSLGA